MSKIGIYEETESKPKQFLTLKDEEGTIDLDVLAANGEYQSTLFRIDKETLKVSTTRNVDKDLGFETNRKGEIEIYEEA